jgi:uncharacterized SAM-binding protein YcdF (DUF218 family)
MSKSKCLRMRLLGRKRILISIVAICVSALFIYEGYEISADQPLRLEDNEIDQLQVQDCGVVLTGGPGRIREAIEILGQKKIKKLVIAGVYKEAQLAEIFPPLPFYPEVDSNDIILEKRSESTYGNAVQSLALVQTLQCRSILLITSQMHMRRAYKIFRTLYPETIQIQKHYVLYQRKDPRELDLAVETIKSVFYLVFGRVI